MKIPKIIHLVWFGGERPKLFDSLVKKIKEINFDYEIIEWNDSNINFELLNIDLFNKCENLGAKSDIFRFEVLYKYGGIYMDYDFIQVKKFDDILDFNFFVGCPFNAEHEVWNSIVGSTKENIICYEFLKGLSNTKPLLRWEINRVMSETGPYYLQKIFDENKDKTNSKKFIGNYFFPFPAVERNKIKNLNDDDIKYSLSFIDDTTYCVHLHTTTWQ